MIDTGADRADRLLGEHLIDRASEQGRQVAAEKLAGILGRHADRQV
jgi:hypothetical protein